MTTIPEGFIEVTGVGSLRPIYVRYRDIQVLAYNWRWPNTKMAELTAKKLEAEGYDGSEILPPPECADWSTTLKMNDGESWNAIETVEVIGQRIREAQEKENGQTRNMPALPSTHATRSKNLVSVVRRIRRTIMRCG